MSNLRDIKNRINNATTIEKISNSMKVISTSRLSSMKSFMKSNKSYFSYSSSIINNLLSMQKEKYMHMSLAKKVFSIKESSNYNKTLYIVMSSDRGLCGAYNQNVVKKFNSHVKNLSSDNFLVFPIGNKSLQMTSKLDKKSVLDYFINLNINVNIMELINTASMYICNLIEDSIVDRIQIIYTKSHSVFSQEVITETIFPIETKDSENDDISSATNQDAIKENLVTDTHNFSSLLMELVRQHIVFNIFNNMVESILSEHTSRLNAMHTANDNSKELKRNLSLEYNKTRQGLITRELIEIISGAETI